MITTLKTAPAVEPVSLDDAKAHMRVTVVDDDVYINTLIQPAREYIEQITGRRLITQVWEGRLEKWPTESFIELPFGRLQSVSSIVYTDSDGNTNTLTPDDYSVDTSSLLGRVVLNTDASWPTASLATNLPIVVTFTCGYGNTANSVPGPIIQAIKFLIADFYENRESVVIGQPVASLPLVERLLQPYRIWEFHR